MKKLLLATLIVGFLTPFTIYAHPGNTDSYGCHTCKTNCPNWGLDYGEYHCHASRGLPQPTEPVRSIRNDSGAGITVPAPEYKTYTPLPVSKPEQTSERSQVQIKTPTSTAEVITPISQPKQQQKKGFWARFFGRIF